VRLTDLLTPDHIRVPLQASDKAGVLRELVGLLGPDDGTSGEEVLAAVMERERQFPTGIGHGVAVPHGRTPAMTGLGMVAGTSESPVPYETVDGQPVRLFFLLAGPETMAGAYVKALSRISRLVRREGVRTHLLSARTPQEFYQALAEAEGV
jgi:mannitol/fructose-specific phosphotransferase system IIA component (Ntr-type)